MKFVLFTLGFVGAPVAWKMKQEGHDVTVAAIEDWNAPNTPSEPPTKEEPEKKKRRLAHYDGMLKKIPADEMVKKLNAVKDKSDYFIMFDTNEGWKYAEQLKGFKGNFPTQWDREMEIDRQKAKDFVKKNHKNLKIQEVHEFKKVEDGIDFLEDTESVWVLKAESDAGKTVVPETDDPKMAKEELIDYLTQESKAYEENGFILEEKIFEPIEITPEIMFYDGELIGTTLDVENKYLGAGNIGKQVGCGQNAVILTDPEDLINEIAFPPIIWDMAKKRKGLFIWDASILIDKKTGNIYFGEFCFSSDTEILTQDGWKTYKDIKITDTVLSLNPKTKELEWKPIMRIVIKPHNGEMIKIKSIDALITPDHHLWFDDGKSMKKFRAKHLPHSNRWKLPRTGVWKGNNQPKLTIPALDVFVSERKVKKGAWIKNTLSQTCETHSGKRGYGVKLSKVKKYYRHTLPEIVFKMEDFCYLLGLWIAEGSFGGFYKGEPRELTIAQSLKNPKRVEIESRLKTMNLKYKVAKNGTFEINNRNLSKYFWENLGLKHTHSFDKFIPKLFKELSPSYLRELFNGYMIGDGNFHKNQWQCATTSKRLADDLQEIIHKLGWVANIKFNEVKGTEMNVNGKVYLRKHNSYSLSTKHQKTSTVAFKKNLSKEQYNGIVWDVSVADNESLMVRRNGNAFISSNCSNRFGWDSFPTQLAMSGAPDGKQMATPFFEKIVKGENPYKYPIGVSVRLFNLDLAKDGTLIADKLIQWKDEASPDVWLFDVKKDESRKDKSRFVNVGYEWDLGVITGVGKDLKEAIDRCYAYVDMFSFEGMLYRPKFDFLSKDYPTSIPNRVDYAEKEDLFTYADDD